jgi:hypothetical protein
MRDLEEFDEGPEIGGKIINNHIIINIGNI